MCAFYHNVLNANPPADTKRRAEELFGVFDRASLVHVRNPWESVGAAVFKDFTRLQATIDSVVEDFGATGLLKSSTVYPYALRLTEHPAYFSTAYVVDRAFQMGRKDIDEAGMPAPKAPVELSTKERAILGALVRYPDATDTLISESVGVARPTVSEKRDAFYAGGMLKRANMPNLAMLGCEIIGFFHIPSNRKLDAAARVDTTRLVLDSFHPVILASRSVECTGIFVTSNYAEYHRCIEEFAERRVQHIGLEVEPFFRTFRISRSMDVHLDLNGPLQELLKANGA